MTTDIGNAVTPGDKSGNWWMLHANGAMEPGSALTMAPVGYTSPVVSPLGFNGSTQYFKSDNTAAFPAADFSCVLVLNANHISGSFQTLLGNFNGTDYTWLLSSAGGVIEADVIGASHSGTVNFTANFTVGAYVAIGFTYNHTTGAMKVRCAGTNATATVTSGGYATIAARGVSFGADTIGTLFWNGTSYGAFWTEKLLSDADIDRIGAMVTPSTSSLTLPWMTANGIELADLASIQPPTSDRRDIGEQDGANDGTLRVTRQTRKRDLKFNSVMLKQSDALVWESLFIGEGHVFNFDALGPYSSKGLGPSTITDCDITASIKKFGASSLHVTLTTGLITWTGAMLNTFGSTVGGYTVMLWWRDNGGDALFHHYVVRSDGAKWLDGIRNDAADTHWLTISGGNVTLAGAGGDETYADDLVCYPFKVLDGWPPVMFAAMTGSFCPTPYLDAAGGLVPEQATRRVVGQVTETLVATASGTRSQLAVSLMAR